MAYKLIAIDLDDTLLDGNKNIPEKSKAAIKRALGAGVEIVLASGRLYDSMKPYNDELGISGHTIASCGGQLVDGGGNLVYSTYVPAGPAKEVLRWARGQGIYGQAYMADGVHYTLDSPFREIYEKNAGVSCISDPGMLDTDEFSTYKLLFVDTPENAARIKAEASSRFPGLKILTSQPEYVEIMNPLTSKDDALKKLAGLLSLGRDEIIAIGDSEIDAGMMDYAGLSVAVGNAAKEILSIADYVAPSNIDGGVAHAIDKFII